MDRLSERLVHDMKQAVGRALAEQVDVETLEEVAKTIYGEAEPLELNNPLATRVANRGVDAIRGAVESAIREALTPRGRQL